MQSYALKRQCRRTPYVIDVKLCVIKSFSWEYKDCHVKVYNTREGFICRSICTNQIVCNVCMLYSIKHGYKRTEHKHRNVALRIELAELVEISLGTCKTINLRHFRLIWLYLIPNSRDHDLDACENVDFLGKKHDFWDFQWHRYTLWLYY